MSIVAPPEDHLQQETILPPIGWSIHTGEEGDHSSSLHDNHGIHWNDIAHPEVIDGTSLQVSNMKGRTLYLYPPSPNDEMIRIVPPAPAPMFAFTRYAQSFMGEERWLYSAFGYILLDYVFLVRIFPGSPTRVIESLLLPRPTVFPL